MVNVFVSYSHADSELALQLASDLRTQEGLDVWIDQYHLVPGDDWAAAIDNAIAKTDVAVILVSEHSLASPAARREWQMAIASAQRVIPALLPSAEVSRLPKELAHIQVVDLTGDYRQGVSLIASSALTSTPRPDRGSRARLEYLAGPFRDVANTLSSAIRQIDFSGSSLDSLFGFLPEALAEALDRDLAVRLLLPDPEYFEDSMGGRNLEVAARSRASLDRFRHTPQPGLAIRLSRDSPPQTTLIVDDTAFVDPLPSSSQPRGLVRIERRGDTTSLFDVVRDSFATAFDRAIEWPVQSRPSAELSPGIKKLATSHQGSDIERVAAAYYRRMGFEVSAAGQAFDPGYDLALLSPKGEVFVVGVKAMPMSRVARSALEELAASAERVGAQRAVMICREPASDSVGRAIREIESRAGIAIDAVTIESLLEPGISTPSVRP